MMPIPSLLKKRVPSATGLLLALALLGILLRLAYVWEVGHHPLLNLALPGTDQFIYDLMAQNLNAAHPLSIQTPVNLITVHFVRFVYHVFGTNPFSLYMAFFALSMISVIFLSVAGGLLFGWHSGLLAGILLIYYRMNFFYDAIIDGTALSQCLLIMTLSLYVMYVKKQKTFLYGLFLIFSLLLCLSRIFYWFLIIPTIVGCIIHLKQWQKPALKAANIVFVILAALCFYQFHSADGYSHKFGVHFYIGNRAGSIGLMDSIPGIPSTSEGLAKDTILQAYAETGSRDHLNRYWIKKTFESYRQTQDSWPDLILKKLSYLTNNYETHNISSVYYYEKHSHLKYYPRLNFAVLLSLAAGGIALVFFRHHRGGKLLLLAVLFLLVMILSIFICSRYRMPLVPLLCLYAGFGIDQLLTVFKEKKYKTSAAVILIALITLLWANHPIQILQKETDIQTWEMESQKAWFHSADTAALRQQYKSWDNLTDHQKILLTMQLEKSMMPSEFNEAYQAIFPSVPAGTTSRNLLLSLRARFEEENFNFQEALKIWEQLAQDPLWSARAQEKIKEIKIAGPLLDKNFRNH